LRNPVHFSWKREMQLYHQKNSLIMPFVFLWETKVIWRPSGLSFCPRRSSDIWHLVGSLAYQNSWESSKKSLNYLYRLMIPFRLLGGLDWDLGYCLGTNLRFAHYSFHSWSLQVNVDPICRSKRKDSTWDSCSIKKKTEGLQILL